MPSISKIRLTNVVYEEGNKRYNDELFLFEGHNGGILLENGGGKTVLIQTALQAVLPHIDLAGRKIKNTLLLENAPAHIAIEWITNDSPRRYVVTAVTLFLTKHGLDSIRYVYEYDAGDSNGIEEIPFVVDGKEGKRPAERGEMQDYYSGMKEKASFFAQTFDMIKAYRAFIEKQYHIISSEWESIVKINSTEGGVEAFFDDCKSTNQLFDRLLIPTVEDSIAGHDKAMFANMFEKQHQSFKNYKNLKQTIEENKRIQERLENYVMTFEKLYHKQQAYLKTKQQAKGVWNLTLSQKQQMTDELTENSCMMTEWETDYDRHKVTAASYDIAVEKAKLEEKELAYNTKYANQLDKEEERDNLQKNYYSLKLAKYKVEIKEEQDNLAFAEEKLADLEKDEEIIDLQDLLDEANQTLLGSYLEEIDKIDQDKQGLTYQLNPILEQINQLTSSKAVLTDNINGVKQQLSGIQAKIKARTDDMEKLKQQILANPQQEQISTELKKWQERSNHLDQEVVRLNQEVKQLDGQIEEAEEQRDKLLWEQTEIERNKNEVAFKLNELHGAQGHVIRRLAGLRQQWSSLEDIYTTQRTIEIRIHEQIEKLKKERNNLLFKERLAYRFVDDYGNQDVFFADPFLAEQLASWKNQLDYVVTGVQYLQNLTEEEREKRKDYPLWPLTLVTTNRAKQQLLDKLNHISDRLQYPIIILTTEEALQVNESQGQDWIAPIHWNHNLETEYFTNWKVQIKTDAHAITGLREQKEKELTDWEDGWKAYHQFLETYPYEFYSSLSSELSDWKTRIEEVSLQIKAEKENITESRSIADSNRNKIQNHSEEMLGLQAKIKEGLRYLSYEKEVDDEQKKEESLSENVKQLEKDKAHKEKELQGFNDEKDALEQRIKDLIIILEVVKGEDAYKKVASLNPIYSGESKQSIKNRIHALNRRIDKITVTQGEWIAKQDAAKKTLKRLQVQSDEIRNQQSDLDENQVFPSDGEQWLETLFIQIKEFNEELVTLNQEVQQALSEMGEQKGKYKLKLEQFHKDSPGHEVIPFEQSLDEIYQAIKLENAKLLERKDYITKQLDRINTQLDSISKAERELEKFIESHHFNAPDIKEIGLTEEQQLAFHYQRKEYVKVIIEEMKNTKHEMNQEATRVEEEKHHVRDFCRKEISDVKLQQMAINGMEHKHTYEDVISFKNNMLTSIERISKYANEHIRKSDEDLQLFINQVHSHLHTIVEELKQIPSKTKVKDIDDWKTIFSFSIPDWDEEVGKTRIRDYIEWILQQLDSERFLNDQGIQDEGKVRNDVEMWLQTKSLLQVVMNNEVMKVSCRKVTNDNHVTSRSYSWEQSNVWSGGEKWSKNMTLFLGILNYVAEKKQHLQANAKRHRSVILDNPFGKASSDHVLNPVFFVAEQLGFQIIALTAHAEGKFLQDYFPVIYSCRLRSSQDSGKKVMTKEKWLHHAYFQDHEPQGLERLGEVEQMELF
jgi:predicted  nucleic acid-binding Zn-ribbon protein